jgi:hypothetical protein
MITTIILLLVWHALADYPLQGDFIAEWKNPKKKSNEWPYFEKNPIWLWVMGAHCMIHAGGVYMITLSWVCALIEFATHWAIDTARCKGRISFIQDQALHLVTKAVIVLWVAVVS